MLGSKRGGRWWQRGRLCIRLGGWMAKGTWHRVLIHISWDTGEEIEHGCR